MALGAIMHELNEDQAAVIRIVRQNLMAVADQIEELEGALYVPIGATVSAEAKRRIGRALNRLDPTKLAMGRIEVMPKDCACVCETCAETRGV
jgi:hypothetical protein